MNRYFLLDLAVCIAFTSASGHCFRIRRVVGGEPLPAGAWPWLVSLNYKGHHPYLELQGLKHLCGGTLIDNSWVLTAGHCVHYVSGSPGLGNPKNWFAVLGEHNRRIKDKMKQRIKIESIFLKNFTMYPKLSEDIALMKLKTPALTTSRVRPIALDIDRRITPGTACQAAGWGQFTSDDLGDPQYGNGTVVPHVVEVQLVSTEECRASYREMWPLIDERVLCFGSSHRQDTCKGDSGGPLICHAQGSQPLVTGVVSIGMGCALEYYPGVYTRVSSYRDWILSIMANN